MIGNLIPGLISLGVAPSTNSYESIATVTVGSGGSATVDFTSIPADYTHLQIRGIGRTDRASAGDTMHLRLNSDTASNYSRHFLVGDGASASADGSANISSIYVARLTAASSTASMFGTCVIDILDYTNSNKYKTIRSLGGNDNNSVNGELGLYSGNWRNTNAITSITLFSINSANFVQYSQFALYGIKGA